MYVFSLLMENTNLKIFNIKSRYSFTYVMVICRISLCLTSDLYSLILISLQKFNHSTQYNKDLCMTGYYDINMYFLCIRIERKPKYLYISGLISF